MSYLFEGAPRQAPERAARLRGVIAAAVRARPATFTEALLGKPPAEYVAWILDKDTWGGELELFILAGCVRRIVGAARGRRADRAFDD